MTAQSKDPNVPDDPNLADLKHEVEKSTQAATKAAEVAKAANEARLRELKKLTLEAQIQGVAIEVAMLEREAPLPRDAAEVKRRLADKQRELAELRARLKREFPETARRWWHTLLFWRRS